MQLYHLPAKEAAQKLQIGMTVLKKYTRQFGIERWPSRIIGSIQRLIDEVTTFQESSMAAGDANTEATLAELRCAFGSHCSPQAAAQEVHSSIGSDACVHTEPIYC